MQADYIIDRTVAYDLPYIIEQNARKGCLDKIYKGDLLIHYQIGVVGCAYRGLIAVKHAHVGVNGADGIDIFLKFKHYSSTSSKSSLPTPQTGQM